jgi:CRISPR system Cascade subunit CasA
LQTAEKVQSALWLACCLFAKNLIGRGDRKPDKKDVKGFVAQMPCIPWYWSTLEAKFHELVQAYTLEKNPDEIELEWLQAVRGALKGSWDEHFASVATGDAWTIRASIKAEAPVLKILRELNHEIAESKESLSREGV